METLKFIKENRLIAISRGVDASKIRDVAKALVAGGIRCIEVTFDHSSAGGVDNTLQCIRILSEEFRGQVLVGAGTVIKADEVESAVDAGAEYIISPNVSEAVIRNTKKLGKVSIPGAMTPTEALLAVEFGANLVKLFPAATLGIDYYKAIIAPLKHIEFVPTGGINPDNIPAFLKVGAAGFGIGGNLINSEKVRNNDWEGITETARLFVAALGK